MTSPDANSPVPAADSRTPRSQRFPATRWSLVVRAGTNETDGTVRPALESLCREYWHPLYAFARQLGRPHHEAEDCTQGFLLGLLASGGIARADPTRGRFRTFLLASMRNYLATDWHRGRAARRGSGEQHLSLDFAGAIDCLGHEPLDPSLTPEQAFDHRWAVGLAGSALAGVRADYAATGRGPLFESLAPFVLGKMEETAFAAAAAQQGMAVATLRVALHRLRSRLAQRMRSAVAETVAEPEDIDPELRYLIAALGQQTPA